MLKSIGSFRDRWLNDFFLYGTGHRKIPPGLHMTLARKLDMINAAVSYRDLRSPPGNRYEELSGKLSDYCAIRVNKQYRLIFCWQDGKVNDLHLDPHNY